MTDYNRVQPVSGNYDILHPGKSQVGHRFFFRKDAPPEIQELDGRALIWDEEAGLTDTADPMEAYDEAKRTLGAYIYSGAFEKFKSAGVYEYLERYACRDQHQRKLAEHRDLMRRKRQLEADLDRLRSMLRIYRQTAEEEAAEGVTP